MKDRGRDAPFTGDSSVIAARAFRENRFSDWPGAIADASVRAADAFSPARSP
jgi:hypothetical protein